MRRIRTIQPSFPKSPSMGRVNLEARLRFIQGFCHPTPSSNLPHSPNERPRDSRKILERSRNFRESTPNDLEHNALSAILERFAEIAESKKSGEVRRR